jgi:hypothetical protein
VTGLKTNRAILHIFLKIPPLLCAVTRHLKPSANAELASKIAHINSDFFKFLTLFLNKI